MVFLVVFLILAIGGRWACGSICPLGILQGLIFKIPFPKKFQNLPQEQRWRKGKYVLFLLLVILVPLVVLPHREQLHGLFLFVKLFGFSSVFLLSLVLYRPFCKYLCPFGVFLGFFNKCSPFRYQVDSSCNHCGLCKRKCKMGLIPYEDPNSMECIRCGECVKSCPKKAIHRKKS